PVSSLSAERGRTYHLKVVAKDQGIPSLSSTALVVVTIGDPDTQGGIKFQSLEYEAKLSENSGGGSEVIKISALRMDGRRARVMYEIVGGNEDSVFEIGTESGTIRVKDESKLDRETQSNFRLVVSAKTEGTQLAFTVVDILLLDVNDNFPRFTQETYIASVW